MTIFRVSVVSAKDGSNVRTEDFTVDTVELDAKVYVGADAEQGERLRALELLAAGRVEAEKLLKRGEAIDQVTVIRGY